MNLAFRLHSPHHITSIARSRQNKKLPQGSLATTLLSVHHYTGAVFHIQSIAGGPDYPCRRVQFSTYRTYCRPPSQSSTTDRPPCMRQLPSSPSRIIMQKYADAAAECGTCRAAHHQTRRPGSAEPVPERPPPYSRCGSEPPSCHAHAHRAGRV